MDQLYEAVEMCFEIANTNQECEFLSAFISCVVSDNDDESDIDLMESKDKLFFKEVLHNNTNLKCNFEKVYQCSKSTPVNWKVAEELDWFIFYIFNRRFGWPDLEEDNGQLRVPLPDAQIRFRKSTKADELKHKTHLVDLLDTVLTWLSYQSVSAMSVLMFSSAIRLAQKAPVTRLHLCIRGCDWLKEKLVRKDINDKLWHVLQDFLILGVTDIWSRVRDACISRIGPIIELIELSQSQLLFDELVRLCDSNANQWQIIDGAISAISAILKRFQKVAYRSDSSSNNSKTNVLLHLYYQIKIGDNIIDRMPSSMVSKTKSLVFILIKHPQQTIRDNAIKAFTFCLDRSPDHEVDSTFQDVFQRLLNKKENVVLNDSVKRTFKTINQQVLISDPYVAQSLISLSQNLFKRVRDKTNYLENWYHYHIVFDQYLSHPASSVRLVTSNIYKYAISQAIGNPLLVKNILHYLLSKWTPDQSILLKTVKELVKSLDMYTRKRLSTSKSDDVPCMESNYWEWREGRLLVYELTAKLIIKNHLWYTFGTTEIESMYSSENTNSKLTTSGATDDSPDHSHLNLYDSSLAIEKMIHVNENHKLSRSLDGRRMTISASNISAINMKSNKAFSETDVCDNLESNDFPMDYLEYRRQSHDVSTSSFGFDFLGERMNLTRSNEVSKANVSTSTQLLRPSIPTSFLVQVKELEESEDVKEIANSNIVVSAADIDRKLPTFRSLLSQMLHTSSESLVDSQWELRRMAKQALPPLGEVLRWFDPDLLSNIISTHLKFEPTLMTFVSLSLLHDAILHCSRLKQLILKPPPTWQSSVASKVVNNLLFCVDENLPNWIKSCHHYLDRSSVIDCISQITVNIIVLSCSNYSTIVSVSSLCKSLVELFRRLDKCIHDPDSGNTQIMNFDLYPGPSCTSFSDNSAIDYAIQLVESVKTNFIDWWQKISSPKVITDYYECHREGIISLCHLLPILTSWLYPVSEMRGDNGRYMRDILKLLFVLSKLWIEIVNIDPQISFVFIDELLKTLEIVIYYIEEKNVMVNVWWIHQLIELVFQSFQHFSTQESFWYVRRKSDEAPILFKALKTLLQRLYATKSRRRATVTSMYNNSNNETSRVKTRRLTVDNTLYGPISVADADMIKSDSSNTNIQLFSSQALDDSVQYMSDESPNDSDDADRKHPKFVESHVLSPPREVAMKKIFRFSLDTFDSHPLKIYQTDKMKTDKTNFKRSSSSLNSGSVTEPSDSDWDSSSESDSSTKAKNSIGAVRSTENETDIITDMITRLVRFNPNLLTQCKPLLTEMDITVLKGLDL